MRLSLRLLTIVHVVALLPGAVVATPQQQLPIVTLGVVHDGPVARAHGALVDRFGVELDTLLTADFEVRRPADKTIEADLTATGTGRALDALLADPDVDLVIVTGPIGSAQAIRRTNLSKPVVALAVLYADIQRAPRADTGSGVANLNYIAIKATEEFHLYREILPFTRLAVLLDEALLEEIPTLASELDARLENLGLDVVGVPIRPNVDATLAAIEDDVDAVFVLPLPGYDQRQFAVLTEGLIERLLPSFSWLGEIEVREGILAGTLPETFLQRLARRAALNVQQILLGEAASSLPVDYPATPRLTINMRTARAIGIEPNWKVLTEATLLADEGTAPAQRWSLSGAARHAIDNNLELRVQEQVVLAGAAEPKIANSFRLPQAGVNLSASFLDNDLSQATLGLVPKRALTGSLGVRQVIWDDAAWANVSIQNSLQESRQQDRNAVRLDIALESSVEYLQVLRAKTLEQIQRDNLNLTRNNLGIARVRVDTGVATRQEIFRWENQIATNRRGVVDAAAGRRVAELQLNRLLNRPLEEPFATDDTGLEDPDLLTNRQQIYNYLEDPASFAVFRDFMSLEAMQASPELLAIDAAARAQARRLRSTGRAFWMPSLTLDAGMQGFVARGGESFSLPLDIGGGGGEDIGDLNWSLGFSLDYSLFRGGARTAEQERAGEELSGLEFQRRAIGLAIEEQVRIALHLAQASLAGIELAEDAATAARSNYDLISTQYQRGAATILDVLDAQNVALVAEEETANATYEFLIDVMRVQRAVGYFDFLMTPAARNAFFDRLEEFQRAARSGAGR